jgi:hypothetical protein
MSDELSFQLENQDQFTVGPPRRYVPVCIRHAHGFEGGPSGYIESEMLDAPVVVDETKGDTKC